MSARSENQERSDDIEPLAGAATGRAAGLRLLRKLLLYHASLALALALIGWLFPALIASLPIGGVDVLERSGGLTVAAAPSVLLDNAAVDRPGTAPDVTEERDRLGSGRELLIVLLGVWLLALPVSWVHRGVHRRSMHDHSLDETTLILPGIVAAIVLVVQHSLALAFSLAGIIAGVQFRRALQDTFDALFILVAIGIGISAGVEALEIAAVLSVFFCYATLFVCFRGDGLESDYVAMKKQEKLLRRAAAIEQEPANQVLESDEPDGG